MAKILFIPTNSREIAQFSLVKPELEAQKHEIIAIALDTGRAMDKNREALEAALQDKGFNYKSIAGYRTRNVLKIIQEESPDIIVTDFSGFTPNAFIYAANHVGIPSLQINDGITSDYFKVKNVPHVGGSLLKLAKRAFRLLFFQANPRPLAYLFTTLISIGNPIQFFGKMTVELLKSTYPISSYTEGLNIAVMSPFARDAQIKMGAPADRVFITGQPRFDLIGRTESNRGLIMAELGLPENQDIIVLATQPLGALWTEKDKKEFIQTVVGAVIEFPEKRLIIKLHPSEKIEEYQEMLAGMDDNKAIICQSIDLYGLLNACDLLMTVHSTVALEAMILNKPVITINLTGRPDAMPYAQSGAALGVYRKEDLAPSIRKALYDPEVSKETERNRRKFVSEHAYKLDGQATKRVAALIIRLIEESKTKRGVLV